MYLPIAVGVDGSPASLTAAGWAAEEAALRQCPLRVLHALPLMPHLLPSAPTPPSAAPTPTSSPSPVAGQQDASTLLREVLHHLALRQPELTAHAEQIHDVASTALVAATEDAELVVVGARGDGGFDGLRVGSTALHVAARSCCPAVVFPADPVEPGPDADVVVGVDARRPPEAALDFAFDVARRYGLPLRVLHAFPPPSAGAAPAPPGWRDGIRAGERDLLAAAIARWQDIHPDVLVSIDAEPAGAGQLLVEVSAKARLLVVGRRRRPSVGGLGPVAHTVLHHAACPVVLVPET